MFAAVDFKKGEVVCGAPGAELMIDPATSKLLATLTDHQRSSILLNQSSSSISTSSRAAASSIWELLMAASESGNIVQEVAGGNQLFFKAARDITQGEELTVNK